jgi:hydrogenase maturation protease
MNDQPSPLKPESAGKTLLLGLGNDILCDDAIGLRVAEALRERLAGHDNLAVATTTEMGLSLLDLIVGFQTLYLIDAIQTGKATPGFVHEIRAGELHTLPAISPHFLGVGEVLALGRRLGMAVPSRVEIFAIEIQDPWTVATQMSPALQAALPGIVERIATALLPVVTP